MQGLTCDQRSGLAAGDTANDIVQLGKPASAPLLEECLVLENSAVAQGVLKSRLRAPRIAGCVQPGQFVHLRLPGLEAHILRRPFSVFSTNAGEGVFEVVYQVVGQGTGYLATVERGARLDAIGPVGRTWQPPKDARKALLVAGGLGAAPLYMLAASFSDKTEVHLVMGAQSAGMLVCRVPFLTYVREDRLHITTDDGSAGRKGLTTQIAQELLEQGGFDYVATCGPEPMQRIIATLAARHNVACEVSLERRMACGVGACLSCVVRTTGGQRRACVDGPIFNAQEVQW